MNRKLMIKVLESLEETYPYNKKIEKLTKGLGLIYSNKEFSKVMAYLASTAKISGIITDSGTKLTFLPNDEAVITSFGIDLLTDIKKAEADEKRTKAITKATIVLALVGFLQAITYFNQFSQGVKDWMGWLMLCIMGAVLLIIFSLSWEPLLHVLGIES